MVIGTATQPLFIRGIRDKAVMAGGKAPPEARLPVGMAGAVLAPLGLLWFALSSFSKMPWIMPMIGTLIFGVGVSGTRTHVKRTLRRPADAVPVRLHLHMRIWVPRRYLSQIRRIGHGGKHPAAMRVGRRVPSVRESGESRCLGLLSTAWR
jgi:hypothetical protein